MHALVLLMRKQIISYFKVILRNITVWGVSTAILMQIVICDASNECLSLNIKFWLEIYLICIANVGPKLQTRKTLLKLHNIL